MRRTVAERLISHLHFIEEIIVARIQHLAIASQNPEKQAEFYKKVFGFEEIRRIDNPRARGVVLTDGAINISVLYFKQDQIDRGLDYTGLHSLASSSKISTVRHSAVSTTVPSRTTSCPKKPQRSTISQAVRQVQGPGKQFIRHR